ncbi:3133_t:CDS:2 [Ambispora leptoticha]|uniref:3133_t:CDS:1 n=1 Tax=Ambispora leptoticha TaxID=144679 RepID=A0A9N8VYZ0_9GLOM|nr:3133_t:CDS:2 [Ambispora leptoticha]
MTTPIPAPIGPTLASTIDPTRSKECFYMANLDYPRYPSLTPDMATEMLTKAMNLINQIAFSFLYIDRPADGQVYLICLPPNDEDLPPDGFHYLENEQSYKMTLPDGRELLCFERRGGYAPNEQFTSKIRRRYRLNVGNENLQILHYARLEDNQRQMLTPTGVLRTPPRKFPPPMSAVSPYIRGQPQPQPQQQTPIQSVQMPQQTPVRAPNQIPTAAATLSSSYMQFPTRATSVPYVGQKGINNNMVVANIKSNNRRGKTAKPREISLARYKRNHDYIEEIFSPHNTSSIKLEPSPYESLNIEERKQQLASLADNEASIETLTQRHDQKIKLFRQKSANLYKSLNIIKNSNSLEELERLQENMRKDLDIVAQPCNKVRMVELTNVPMEEEELQEAQAQQDINNLVSAQQPQNDIIQPLLTQQMELSQLDPTELVPPFVLQQGLVVGGNVVPPNGDLHAMLDVSSLTGDPAQLVYDELEVLASHIGGGDAQMED